MHAIDFVILSTTTTSSRAFSFTLIPHRLEVDRLPYLNAWNALVKMSPSLETFLKTANTGKGEIEYIEALKKVRIYSLFDSYASQCLS